MVSGEQRPDTLKTDLRDIIQVFVYNNLSVIISPDPLLRLPPTVRAALEAYINYLPGGFGFSSDIQDILNAFVLTNINSISSPSAPINDQNQTAN